jgi:hypothetical protein
MGLSPTFLRIPKPRVPLRIGAQSPIFLHSGFGVLQAKALNPNLLFFADEALSLIGRVYLIADIVVHVR